MKIFNSLESAYDLSDGCVLAVGNFDGVHRGHQLIFQTAVGKAREAKLKAVLFTFSRHPAEVISPGRAPHPLMAVRDRLAIAEGFGFDAAFVLDFDRAMASLSPQTFVQDVLLGYLGVKAVVAGQSWRFGHGREGDMNMLAAVGKGAGFEASVVEPCMVDSLPVSSTRIREALKAGDVGTACELLGRPHFARGTVVSGRGKGRELGFPTVNLDCGKILVPGDGVYAGGFQAAAGSAGEVPGSGGAGRRADSVEGPAAISIGTSPTFANGAFAVEAHLVGQDEDLYGQIITIAFLRKLREQWEFGSEGDLARQIAHDVEQTRERFRVHQLEEIPF